jgi:hypothetical protein
MIATASADLLTPSALLGPLALVATSFFLVVLLVWLNHMTLWQLFQSPFDASLDSRIEKAYRYLEIPTAYPSLAPLPPSVLDVNTKKKEKAYGNSLKHQVSEVWRREMLEVSPSLPAGSQPEGRMDLLQGDTVFELKNYHEPSMVFYRERSFRVALTLRTA